MLGHFEANKMLAIVCDISGKIPHRYLDCPDPSRTGLDLVLIESKIIASLKAKAFMYDAETGELLRQFDFQSFVRSLGPFSPLKIALWDLRTHTVAQTFKTPSDEMIRIWNLDALKDSLNSHLIISHYCIVHGLFVCLHKVTLSHCFIEILDSGECNRSVPILNLLFALF